MEVCRYVYVGVWKWELSMSVEAGWSGMEI